MLMIDGITYGYRGRNRVPVLRELDWTIAPGRRVLLLGVNGAGKTTLLKLMCGFLRPQSGGVDIEGKSGRRILMRRVAWMPQEFSAVRGLSVVEQIAYAAWLSGQDRDEAESSALSAVSAVDLTELKGRPVHQLSGGQQRRVGLAEVIATQADVLLLDEPTNGLDPAQRQNFNKLLRDVPSSKTVVVSTHHVEDLEGLYDGLAILSHGRIAFYGPPTTLRDRAATLGLPADSSIEQIFTHMVDGGSH